jgi:hypothetical protein
VLRSLQTPQRFRGFRAIISPAHRLHKAKMADRHWLAKIRESDNDMAEYKFHWWAANGHSALTPNVTFAAPSHMHGAALALQRFVDLGCDISAPLAHVDVTESDGARQTLLVEEVLDWLHDPEQQAFVAREGLRDLLR